MAYTRDGDRVRLDLSVEDYENVVLALGMAATAAIAEHGVASQSFRTWIRLSDAVTEGNDEYPRAAAARA